MSTLRMGRLAGAWIALSASVVWGGAYAEWRGPGRRGAVAGAPPVSVDWPVDGPRMLWQSDEIPGGGDGGYGSVVVSGGRAFVYVDQKYRVAFPHRVLTAEAVRQLGAEALDLPADLLAKVEQARLGKRRTELAGDALRDWLRQWSAKHFGSEADRRGDRNKRRFASIAMGRIGRGRRAMPLDMLRKLRTIADRRFPTAKALDDWLAEQKIDVERQKEILRQVPTHERTAWDQVHCFGAADGKRLWKFQADSGDRGRAASGTPTVAGGRCFVAGASGVVYCLDAATGKVAWRVRANESAALIHASVLVADGVVVCAASPMVALDAATGRVLWRQKHAGGREASPALWRSAGHAYVIANSGGSLVCMDLRRGEALWQERRAASGRSSPVVVADVCVVRSSDTKLGLAAYRLATTGPTRLWNVPALTAGGSTPSMTERYVYAIGKSSLACVDLASGKLVWQGRASFRGYTSPLVVGGTLSLPRDTNGKLTLLVFVEPSAEPNAEFPLNDDGEGKDKQGGHQSTAWIRRGLLSYACDLADRHVNKDVNTVVAFLSDDADRIGALIKTRKLTCRAAMVPGGLANPMVRRLGILSADRSPNLFLLRRDGAIAWHASGVPHIDAGAFASMLGSKVQIEVCEVEHAYKALEKGDFKEAARVFGGPYLPWTPDRFGWRGPRYHGQAVAHMGAKNWDAALESIDKAIDAQKLKYFQGRRGRDNANWRKEAATVTVQQPDDILTELWAAKAVILNKLGRKEDAATMSRRSKEVASTEPSNVYKLFHERLKNWRMNNKKEIQKP